MNLDFYTMIPGAIGVIEYYWDDSENVPDKLKNIYVDSSVGETLHAMVQKSMMDPSYQPDIQAEYMKARSDARTNFTKSRLDTKIKFVELQVGNKECLDYVLKLQSDPNFKGWFDENIIKAYITETQSLLKQDN